jgi:hypothetical protein
VSALGKPHRRSARYPRWEAPAHYSGPRRAAGALWPRRSALRAR